MANALPIGLFALTLVLLAAIGWRRRTIPILRSTSMRPTQVVPLAMQVLVSICLLGSGLFVIMSSSYSASDKHWGYGAVGSILGFWLKR